MDNFYKKLASLFTENKIDQGKRQIRETAVKKGGVALNGIRPKPIDAKPGDTIIFENIGEGNA